MNKGLQILQLNRSILQDLAEDAYENGAPALHIRHPISVGVVSKEKELSLGLGQTINLLKYWKLLHNYWNLDPDLACLQF